MGSRIRWKWTAVLSISLLVAGSVLAAWAMCDQHKHHPYRVALDRARDWATREKDRFDPQNGPSEEECSLKIAHVELFWDDVHEQYSHAINTASVSLAGGWVRASYGPEYRILESQGRLSVGALSAVASELSALPPSDAPIPLGSAVVIVGFPEHGVWTTRIYEKKRHEPRVGRLADIVGLDLK